MKKRSTKNKIFIITSAALMTALIAVCSWLTIPATVPFTLQTLAVFMALFILGGKIGTISIAVYVALGAIGVPVFANFGGGIGHLLGPTGGYIFGFILSGVFYMALEKIANKNFFLKMAVGLGAHVICYLTGTIMFCLVLDRTFIAALSVCVIPYIIPDVLKILLAALVADRTKKPISKLFGGQL